MPVTHHSGGSGIPTMPELPIRNLLFVMETSFYANRALWHMVWGGVFERFPDLKLILTEQGTDWVLPLLTRMDDLYAQMRGGPHRRARGAGRRRPVQEPRGDLRPQHLDRRQLPGAERRRPLPRDRPRPDHVGQRLPAPRGRLAVRQGVAAAQLRGLVARPTCA